MNHYAVILAGGPGTRLWPLSRRTRPKQLLRLFKGRSLLRLSCERLRAVLPAERIAVVTLEEHLSGVAAELPELPRDNLIGEPCPRDTANAVALAAGIVHARDPAAVLGVFTADHVIAPVEEFARIVRRGYAAAEQHPDALITFGIRPTYAHPGLGYVQRGEPLGDGLFAARSFREKPDEPTARAMLAAGDWLWNSGMFVWRTATILEQLRQRLPDTHAALTPIAAQWDRPDARQRLAGAYPALRRISIDYAVLEHAPRVLVVEMPLEWADVGSWAALSGVLKPDAAGNTVAAAQCLTLDARNNVIVCEDDHLIVALGVEDLVIVRSPDATLVCRAADVQRIRELVTEVQRRCGERYT